MQKRLNIAFTIMTVGIAWWLMETLFFLFVYGWHVGPINIAERRCDFVASITVILGWCVFIDVLIKQVRTLAKIFDNGKKETDESEDGADVMNDDFN